MKNNKDMENTIKTGNITNSAVNVCSNCSSAVYEIIEDYRKCKRNNDAQKKELTDIDRKINEVVSYYPRIKNDTISTKDKEKCHSLMLKFGLTEEKIKSIVDVAITRTYFGNESGFKKIIKDESMYKIALECWQNIPIEAKVVWSFILHYESGQLDLVEDVFFKLLDSIADVFSDSTEDCVEENSN